MDIVIMDLISVLVSVFFVLLIVWPSLIRQINEEKANAEIGAKEIERRILKLDA